MVHVAIMPRLRFRVHRWELTAEALYTRTGWLTVSWEIVPVSRVQTVTTYSGPLERRIGLSTLTVTTASAMGPMSIRGLSDGDASKLADTLARIAAVTPGDAT
jgi:membrane protein YdbS with pleckstrin-like domain